MINFNKLRFKNFGSFGNNFTEIDFTEKGLILVSGLNGQGKSFAYLDALTFALFGKPFRKINIPQLVNSVNTKSCVVEVIFTIGSTEYKVVRGLSPKIFQIFKNDELLDQDAKAKDYQNILEEQILKMNYKTFTQVVILGRSSFVPFMQLSPADRRSVIENILDINIFSTMNAIAKAKLSLIKDLINDICRKIETTEEKISFQNKYIEKIKSQTKESEEKLQTQIQEHLNLIFECEDTIKDLSEDFVSPEQVRTETLSLRSEISKMNSLKDQIETNIVSTQKDVDFYEDNDSCPVCKQGLEESFRKEKIDLKTSKVTELEDGLILLKEKISEKKYEIENSDEKYKKLLETEKKIESQKSLIESSKSQIIKIKEEISNFSHKSEELNNENNSLSELHGTLTELQTDLNNKKQQKRNYEICVSLLKDSGIKSKIIKQYLPVVNKVISKFLKSMNFFTQFELDEEFNETIKSRFRDKFSYMSFSEGEKLRIDLALLFAWREVAKLKNSANCNLLILDEIFDSSLDTMGTEELMKTLHGVGLNGTVYIISHRMDSMVDKFTKAYQVKKVKNFSKVVSVK
jgi:DNA repair exonuclease SbcCD ATPase subunit